MSRAIRLYQYLAPAILTPLSAWLWWREYGNAQQAAIAWLIPVLWAYIVPAVGTNVCKVWEFDVRLKLGRFRPHHGFVFGSATAMIAWLVHAAPAQSWADVARNSLIMASVLGFWNFLYEVAALRSGVLKVYNEPWARGAPAEAIAYDYAPWFFGGFGAAYGFAIAVMELYAARWGLPTATLTALACALLLGLCIAVPVLGFMRASLARHGHAGTRPVERRQP